MKTDLKFWADKARRIVGDAFIKCYWAPKGVWIHVKGLEAANKLNERLLGKAEHNIGEKVDNDFKPTGEYSIFIETATWNR